MQAAIQQSSQRSRRRRSAGGRKNNRVPVGRAEVMRQLHDLLQGDRGMVEIYSKSLENTICFINPDIIDPESLGDDRPLYTTREISFVLSLSPEEFRRYHYLKTNLV